MNSEVNGGLVNLRIILHDEIVSDNVFDKSNHHISDYSNLPMKEVSEKSGNLSGLRLGFAKYTILDPQSSRRTNTISPVRDIILPDERVCEFFRKFPRVYSISDKFCYRRGREKEVCDHPFWSRRCHGQTPRDLITAARTSLPALSSASSMYLCAGIRTIFANVTVFVAVFTMRRDFALVGVIVPPSFWSKA